MLLVIAHLYYSETQSIYALCVPMPVYVKRDLTHLQRILVEARDKVLTADEQTDYLKGYYSILIVLQPKNSTVGHLLFYIVAN